MMNKYIVTILLIICNVVVFAYTAIILNDIWMNDSRAGAYLLRYGALFNPYVIDGQTWRMVTSMFLHFGVLHLVVNMIALFNGGTILEPTLGHLRLLLLYFICGVAASLGSIWLNEFTISAGASGALFGLYGYALVIEILLNINDRGQLGRVIVSFVFFVIVSALISNAISVDIWGHIFGFIAGVTLSLLHHRMRWLEPAWQMLAVLVILPFMLVIMPHDQLQYYNMFQRLLSLERKTSKVFSTSRTDAEYREGFASAMNGWDSLHADYQRLKNVPASVVGDTLTLRRYTALRKQEMVYRVTMIDRDSYIYLDSLDVVSAGLDSVPPISKSLNFNIEPAHKDSVVTPPAPRYEPARVMYDKSWKETTDPEVARYYRLGTKDSLGKWQGQLRDYYSNGDVQMRGRYTDDVKDGIFIYYSSRRTYESSGRYVKEQAVGKWEYFHWNGKLHREVAYGDETLTQTVYDSLGNVQVSGGRGKETTWYSNGQIREEGNYVSGKREGYWHGYFDDGRPMYEEMYIDNRLVRGIAIDRKNKRYVYDQLSVFPMPVKGMDAFKKYVSDNIRRPPFSSGRVEVIFTVGVDGAVWDVTVLKGISPECDAEAIRLVKEGPAWRAGMLHGFTPIQGTGYVVINF